MTCQPTIYDVKSQEESDQK